MINLKKISKCFCLLSVSIISSISIGFAQSEVQGSMEDRLPVKSFTDSSENIVFMGLTGGANNPVGPFKSSSEIGLVVGAQPELGIGYGGEVNTTRLDDADRTQRTLVLAQMAYKLGGDIPVLRRSYIALGAGPAIVKSQAKWAIAPAIGFDIPLNNQIHKTVSIGLNAKYVGITNSADSYVGSAAVKYWY